MAILLKRPKTFSLPQNSGKSFFDGCDRIGIWEWDSRYEEPGILDGSSWRVVIEKGDKQIDSSCSNKGPDKLDVLFNSVRELLGGIDFY